VPARSAGLEGCCSGAIEIGLPISSMMKCQVPTKSAFADFEFYLSKSAKADLVGRKLRLLAPQDDG
jgi:hypothetical protein